MLPERSSIPLGTVACARVRVVDKRGKVLRHDSKPARTEVCKRCGGLMIQTGTCMTCTNCGETSGCGRKP